jgi:hypothetical protein
MITSNPITYSYVGISKCKFCFVKTARILDCAMSNNS